METGTHYPATLSGRVSLACASLVLPRASKALPGSDARSAVRPGDPAQFQVRSQVCSAARAESVAKNSSGGKEHLKRISQMGDQYLRRLLVIGATAMVRQFKMRPEKTPPQVAALLARKTVRVATTAMTNKEAWSVLLGGQTDLCHSTCCCIHDYCTRAELFGIVDTARFVF